MITEKPERRFARLLVETLQETDDVDEAILAAEYAMELPDASFAFVESEHPRGQPENAGQFVEKVHQVIRSNQGIQTHQIAKHLNRPIEHVHNAIAELVNQGKLKAVKPGKHIVFKTAQGSSYIFQDGKSQRNKSEHVGHEKGDTGIKQTSDMTVFIDPEHARYIGMWGTSSAHGKRIIVGKDSIQLVSMNEKIGKLGRDGPVIPFSTKPAKGVAPLELWDKNDKGWFRASHPGNTITEIDSINLPPDEPKRDDNVTYEVRGRGYDKHVVGKEISADLIDFKKDDLSIETAKERMKPMIEALKKGKKLPPIELLPKPNGRFELHEGNARVMAYRALNMKVPEAIIMSKEIATASGVRKRLQELPEAHFAFDIFNRRAQGILNRAMEQAKKLSKEASKAFVDALKLKEPSEMVPAIIKLIEKYRTQLAKLLTATQIAAVLEGAREVAKKLPTVPPAGFGAPFPTSIPPEVANELVERIKAMSEHEKWHAAYNLPPDQQQFVFSQMRIQGGTVPPPLVPRGTGEPEDIHFPIIDEAVRELSSKNVIDRYSFDRLDAAARQKAFTVARVDADETLVKIRDALAENVQEGADFETFKEKVLEEVEPGSFMSDSHMENVFRTNVQTAFSDGQMNVLSLPFVRTGFPYVAYEAIHDDRVEDTHLAMEKLGIDGTNIYRIDDHVFKLFRPPWRWLCRCSYIPYTVRMAAEAGVKEAVRWLATGIEPRPPAYVPMPPFQPPPGFRRDISPAIRLSLQSLDCKMSHGTAEVDEELWQQCQDIIPLFKPSKLPCEIGTIQGYRVILVDGNLVKINMDPNFVEANNCEESPEFIPKGEVWLDASMHLT